MLFALVMGVLSAITVLVVMTRLGLRKFMGYPAFMDAGVTVLLAWLLYGTYTGMVAAIVGGLFFSATITVIRRVYGYSKLERKGLRLVWVNYVPDGIDSTDMYERTKQCILNLKLSRPLITCIASVLVLACIL